MKNAKKFCVALLAAYVLSVVLFRAFAGNSFSDGIASGSPMVTERAVVGEILPDAPVRQSFSSPAETITQISVLATNYGKDIGDTLEFTLLDDTGAVAAKTQLSTAGLPDGSVWTAEFSQCSPLTVGAPVTLEISSLFGSAGKGVSIYYGDSVSAGKFELNAPAKGELSVGETTLSGQLCFQACGRVHYALADWYWPAAGVGFLLLLLFCARLLLALRKGTPHVALRLLHAFSRYGFLLKQLVSRDFKTKYKRSLLGVLWSLMNPLLTMLVMYIVFSTIFKSSIANFPVYLLIGIVCWNFFSETSNACLTSITGNAALITKVYVPKYMYPLSRSVSCVVNLGMALLPLLGVLLLTRTALTPRWLLVPFPLVCLFLFSMGMGLLLASMMVYFRDIQFLWGVVSTLWMYLTPIFYDASIIPEKYMTLYKMNPLYHIVRILRILLIDGVSPEPKAFLLCAIATLVPLLLGVLVFKKSQDRFVLYL